jgi:hypothetical protein
MLTQPQPDHSSKASIREVYDIVSRLEEKFLDALEQSEKRIVQSIEERDRVRRGDIARLGEDVDSLKEWRKSMESQDIASVAERQGRLWPFYAMRRFVDEYWKIMLIVFAALAWLINDLHVTIQ